MFLHLRKAFDVIDHSLLRQKLKANGSSGAEHAWFRSYLTNRTHFVQCNGVNSNERTVTHGVPQGSVLGPTIFCIHINGVVPTTPEGSVFLYADDTETHHSSPTLETAVLKMNSNLQNISTWLRNNNLIHSWYWAWWKHVTSRDSCYPIGCQILHVLSILYRILQWTDLWIKSIVCLCLQERFCCCTKPQRYMVSESGSYSRFRLFNNVIWTSTLVNGEFRKRLKHARRSTEWGTTTRTSCSSTDIYQQRPCSSKNWIIWESC